MSAERATVRPALAGIGILAALILLYSLLILQRILLGVIVAGGLVGGAVLLWLTVRAVRALERIAISLEDRDGDEPHVTAPDGSAPDPDRTGDDE